MKVKVKKLDEKGVVPKYAKSGDAGLDLTAISVKHERGYVEYGTGLSFEIPSGFVGLIFPRSSISNVRMSLTNSVGLIDSSYRGEIKFRFKPTTTGNGAYAIGDRIGQLVIMPYPEIELEEVEELNETDRGTGGFGSTDSLTKLPEVSIDGAGMVNNKGIT